MDNYLLSIYLDVFYIVCYIILSYVMIAKGFFERFSPFTHSILYQSPYQSLSTGSGSILGAGASRLVSALDEQL